MERSTVQTICPNDVVQQKNMSIISGEQWLTSAVLPRLREQKITRAVTLPLILNTLKRTLTHHCRKLFFFNYLLRHYSIYTMFSTHILVYLTCIQNVERKALELFFQYPAVLTSLPHACTKVKDCHWTYCNSCSMFYCMQHERNNP